MSKETKYTEKKGAKIRAVANLPKAATLKFWGVTLKIEGNLPYNCQHNYRLLEVGNSEKIHKK